MDSTAFSLCMDNKMPIIVFDLFKPRTTCAAWSWAKKLERSSPVNSKRNIYGSWMKYLLEAEEKMIKTEEFVQHEFTGVRTGKASPGDGRKYHGRGLTARRCGSANLPASPRPNHA